METSTIIANLRDISNMRSASNFKRTICKAAAQRLEQLSAELEQVKAERDASLREQEERENPQPLSLDELRKMGGEPYYHVSLQGGENHWAILDPFIANQIECYHYGECWLAYRSKPKE